MNECEEVPRNSQSGLTSLPALLTVIQNQYVTTVIAVVIALVFEWPRSLTGGQTNTGTSKVMSFGQNMCLHEPLVERIG